MSAHPVLDDVLDAMPWLTIARAPMRDQGRYYPEHQTLLIRHGLRGARYFSTLAHELAHILRGDSPCCDNALDARQESYCDRDAARLLIDIRELGEVAAQYDGDPHRMADELDVDLDTLRCRVEHLHPAERGYLKRRLAHTEESA